MAEFHSSLKESGCGLCVPIMSNNVHSLPLLFLRFCFHMTRWEYGQNEWNVENSNAPINANAYTKVISMGFSFTIAFGKNLAYNFLQWICIAFQTICTLILPCIHFHLSWCLIETGRAVASCSNVSSQTYTHVHILVLEHIFTRKRHSSYLFQLSQRTVFLDGNSLLPTVMWGLSPHLQ